MPERPSDDSLHTIVRRDGDHWVVFFDSASWGEPYGRSATFRLGSDDSFVIKFDLATVDDCRYFSRIDSTGGTTSR